MVLVLQDLLESILGIATWFVPLVDAALRALKANSRFCWVGPARSPRFSSNPPSVLPSVPDVLCFFVVCRRAPAETSAWFRQLVQCATCCKPRGNARVRRRRRHARRLQELVLLRCRRFAVEGCGVRGPHSSRFCSQAMKPTRTSSETFHTWPQTTPRSSNAAAPTSGSNLPPPPPPPPACVQQMPAHVQGVSTCTFLSWLPATCWVMAQLVSTPDGRRALNSEFFVRQIRTTAPKRERLYESSARRLLCATHPLCQTS